jgi:O-antigen/teichoic acid export membrane protein
VSRVDLSFAKLGRQTLIYGGAFILGRAASFIMLPVYTRYLTPADYGVLQLVQMTVEIAAIILAAGINNGVMRFYFKARTREEKGRVIATALYLLESFNALTALVLFASATMLAGSLLDGPESRRYLDIAAASILFEAFNLIPLLYLQALQKAHLYAVASVGRLILQLGLNILFVVFLGWGVEGVLVSTLITNLVMGALLTGFVLPQTGVRASRRAAWNLLRFGIPYRFTQMGTFVLTFGDRYFLKLYHDLDTIGIYSLAYQFGFVLMYIATIPFLQAWNPQRFELASEPAEVRDPRYNQGLVYLSLLLVSAAAGIAIFVGPLLRIMSDPSFLPAAALVPVILAAYVVQSWTDVAELGIQVSERTQYATFATWTSVVAILALYLLLVPPLGGLGAALATLIAFAIRFFCFYYWSQRLWPVRYRWRPSLLLLGYATLAVCAGLLWSPEGLLAQIGWCCALFSCYLAMGWFGGPLSSEQRRRLLEMGRSGVAALAGAGSRG